MLLMTDLTMTRCATVLALALLLTGCTGLGAQRQAIALENTTRAYERAIRWGDFDAAEEFRAPADRLNRTPIPGRLNDIRVTSYEPVDYWLSADMKEARIVVDIRYYNEHRMKEVTVTDRQTWRYDDRAARWYLVDPLPAFE
jgi:hypothetical protein